MIDWKPIDTAPKDGTLILVTSDEQTFVGQYNSCIGGWEIAESCFVPAQPTHWIELRELNDDK